MCIGTTKYHSLVQRKMKGLFLLSITGNVTSLLIIRISTDISPGTTWNSLVLFIPLQPSFGISVLETARKCKTQNQTSNLSQNQIEKYVFNP